MSNIEGERIMGELEREGEDVDTEQQSIGARLAKHIADVPAGESALVDDIKAKIAELIDMADGLKENDPRYSALAITQLETAEHWMIKAATT
jgi:hypothetical protein